MPYCSRCGVEVDAQIKTCPLCAAPIQRLPMDDGSPWPVDEAPVPVPPPMNTDERKGLARTITTLGFLIPVSVVLTVDWFVTRSLDWSLYALSGLGAAWLWAIFPLALNRRPYALILAETAVGAALEIAIGVLAGKTGWLMPIGIPIIAAAGFLTAGVTTMARRSPALGGNLAGWILLAIAILALATDMLVEAWLGGTWRPGWSIIAASTTVPIAVLLLYLHYRPSKRTRLRRYFHL